MTMLFLSLSQEALLNQLHVVYNWLTPTTLCYSILLLNVCFITLATLSSTDYIVFNKQHNTTVNLKQRMEEPSTSILL